MLATGPLLRMHYGAWVVLATGMSAVLASGRPAIESCPVSEMRFISGITRAGPRIVVTTNSQSKVAERAGQQQQTVNL